MHERDTSWIVIAQIEDEYAVWPVSRPAPATWRAIGVRGTRAECEAFVHALDHETRADVLRRRLESAMRWP